MANSQYTVSNTDRSGSGNFTVPGDEDGGAGDNSFPLQYSGDNASVDSYVHIDNGWDTNVDVTLQGSHEFDSTMSSAATDGSTVTVGSGGGTDFFDVTTGHSFIEVDVNPVSTPGSGNLVLTFQSRKS